MIINKMITKITSLFINENLFIFKSAPTNKSL